MSETEDKQIPRDAKGRFPKGVSGNPSGGSKSSRIARERIAERLDDILASLFLLIDHGDVSAIKLALERVAPALRPEAEASAIEGLAEAATLVEKAEVILREIARGNVDAERGSKVLAAIGTAASLSQLEELKARMAALENPTGKDLT